MEFWGIEVKPGQTVKCEPGDERVLHLSQASLGESKKEKGSENVSIFVNINNQKLVIGTLSTEKCAQIQYDLVFEKEFELSHGSKNTSVFFVGYRSIFQGYESEDFSDSDSEEDLAVAKKANVLGNPSKTLAGKATAEKDASGKGDNVSAKLKAKAEIKEPIKDDKNKKVEGNDEDDSGDDDDGDDDDDSEEESDDDEDMVEVPGDNSSDEDDESSEEEGTPKKVENANKRKTDSASKTPIPEKKAKLITPAGNQKTGGEGKKSVHVATPYPSKQGGKPQQSPKAGGTVSCKSCNRTFTSDNALQAHNKAKHGSTAAK